MKKGGVGAKPKPKSKAGGKAPPTPSLGCFCACIGISSPFILPTQNLRFPLLGGWKDFAQVFIDNRTKNKSYF